MLKRRQATAFCSPQAVLAYLPIACHRPRCLARSLRTPNRAGLSARLRRRLGEPVHDAGPRQKPERRDRCHPRCGDARLHSVDVRPLVDFHIHQHVGAPGARIRHVRCSPSYPTLPFPLRKIKFTTTPTPASPTRDVSPTVSMLPAADGASSVHRTPFLRRWREVITSHCRRIPRPVVALNGDASRRQQRRRPRTPPRASRSTIASGHYLEGDGALKTSIPT